MSRLLVIDNCVLGTVFSRNSAPGSLGVAIRLAVDAGKVVAICNQTLMREYKENWKLHPYLEILVQRWRESGKLQYFDENSQQYAVCRKTHLKKKTYMAAPEDWHIVHLALISGCRMLHTAEVKLCRDFSNKKIIRPPGKYLQTDADVAKLPAK